jgi:type I restriction enzyme S subunit
MWEFDSKVRNIHKQIENFAKENENLAKQRDLLLPRLMSGKLEVK